MDVFLGKRRSSSESTVPIVLTARFVQSLEICPAIFQTWKKSGGGEVWKK